MNIIKARHILSSLERNIEFQAPLGPQLEQNYIPTLIWNGVVPRKSLRGRIAHFLTKTQTQQSLNARVRQVIVQAFKTLRENPEKLKTLSPAFRIKLQSEFHAEIEGVQPPSKQEILDSEDFKQLAEGSEAAIAKANQALLDKSLLRQINANALPALTHEQFLATLESSSGTELVKRWESICNSRPELSQLPVKERLEMLKNALELDQELRSSLLSKNNPLSQERLAEKLATTVHDLKTGQRWLYAGNYGKAKLSWNEIFTILKKLPSSAQEELPSVMKTLMAQDHTPDPKECAQKIVHEGMEELRKRLPTINISSSASLLQPLFQNESREIPENLATCLPQCIGSPLNQMLPQGILGNVTSLLAMAPTDQVRELLQFLLNQHQFYQGYGSPIDQFPLSVMANILTLLPKPAMIDLINWISQQGDLVGTPEQRELFFKRLEDKIVQSIQGQSETILESITSAISNVFKNLERKVPGAFIEIAGLDHLSSGNFWLEFERQADDRFAVLVYATGLAAQYHSTDSKGKSCWPMYIGNISVEKMNPGFFQRLLYHQLEPACNPSAISRPKDLYEGVLAFLKGTVISDMQPPAFSMDGNEATPEELAGAFLIGPTSAVKQGLLSYHIQQLTAFCHPYLTGSQRVLVIPDKKTADLLSKAADALEEKMEAIRSTIHPEYLVQIEATIKEIRNAVETFQTTAAPCEVHLGDNPLNLPPFVITALREQLHNSKISLQDILSSKPILNWALGEEIGEFVDAFVETLNSQPFTPPAPPSVAVELPEDKKGWLRQVMATAYYRMAFEALKTAFDMARLYNHGFSPFTIASLTDRGLRKILPEPILQWYLLVLSYIKQALVELGIKIVLSTVCNAEQAKEIYQAGCAWRATIQNLAKETLGKGEVSYHIQGDQTKSPELFSLDIKMEAQQSIFSETLKTPQPIVFGQPQKIDATNTYRLLASWKNEALKFKENDSARLLFLVDRLQFLDIPNPTRRGWWDEIPIEEIPKFMEVLLSLSETLHSNQVSFEATYYNQPDLYGRVVCSNYNILSIMERLARRSPDAQLGCYSLNAYPMLYWLKDEASTISDPQVLEQFRKLCQHFFPQLDFYHLPPSSELHAQEKRCLFYYPNMRDFNNSRFLGLHATDPSHILTECIKKRSLVELEYLSERMREPEFRKRCQKELAIFDPKLVSDISDLRYWSKETNTSFDDLSEEDQLRLLFIESFYRERPNPLFSPVYIRLRRQNLMCNHFLAQGIESRTASNTFLSYSMNLNNPHTPPEIYTLELSPTQSLKASFAWFILPRSFESFGLDLSINSAFFYNMSPYNKIRNGRSQFINVMEQDAYYARGRHSQSRIVAHSSELATEYQDIQDLQEKELFALSRSEPSEEIIRILAYLKTHKERFDIENRDLLRHTEKTLFRSGALAAQLKESPHLAKVIGEMMTELVKDSLNKPERILWIAYIGLKLKKYCTHYAPEHEHAFPNFYNALDQVIYPEGNMKRIFNRLKALAYLQENPHADREELETLFLYAQFTQEIIIQEKPQDKDTNFLLSEVIQLDFAKSYQPMLQQLSNEFKDNPQQRQRIAEKILSRYKIPLRREDGLEWNSENPYHLSKNDIHINLEQGTISGTGLPHEFLVDNIKSSILHLHPKIAKLRLAGNNLLATEDQSVKVTYHIDNINPAPAVASQGFVVQNNRRMLSWRLTQIIDGKEYEWTQTNASHIIPEDVMANCHTDEPGYGSCWIEKTANEEKNLLICIGKDKPYHSIQVKLDPATKQYLVVQGRKPRVQVPTDLIKNSLQPLYRFCTPDEIHAFRKNEDKTRLTHLEIVPFKLQFTIEETATGLKAVSQKEFPGYAISSNQNTKLLQGFNSYLLLENQAKEKKVLIPAKRWIGSILERYCKTNTLLMALVHSQLSALEASHDGKYFAFDLSNTGELTSDNPEAILYLTILYLLQGQLNRAIEASEQFETLCRKQPFSTNLNTLLGIISLIPFESKNLTHIRGRIFAAFEENRLLHSVNESLEKKFESNTIPYEDFAVIKTSIDDLRANLNETNPRKKLSQAQEWFLFQFIFSRVDELIESMESAQLVGYLKNFGEENILQVFGIAPDILEYYHALKEKWGQKAALSERILQFISHASKKENLNFKLPKMFEAPKWEIGRDNVAIANALVDTKFSPLDNLKIEKLQKEMEPRVIENPPLDCTNTNAETFRKYFVSYYALARGEFCLQPNQTKLDSILNLVTGHWESAEVIQQKQQLDDLLTLYQGGWDSQTEMLIRYLKAVRESPQLYWTSEELVNALQQDENSVHTELNYRLPGLWAFFTHLQTRSSLWTAGSRAGMAIAKSTANYFMNKTMGQHLPHAMDQQLSTIPKMPGGFTGFAINWGAKALHTLYAPPATVKIEPAPSPLVAAPPQVYNGLDSEDAYVDDLLNSMFDQMFENVTTTEPKQKRVDAFDIAEDDASSVKARISDTNQSIEDYYDRAQQNPQLQFKGSESLWKSYSMLMKFRAEMRAKYEKELELILNSVNTTLPKASHLKIEDLKKMWLDGDFRQLEKESGLSAATLNHLERALAKHYLKEGRLHQLDRLAAHFETLAGYSLATSRDKFQEKVEAIARECKAKRMYSLTQMPLRITRHLLAFEADASFLLWAKQINRMEDLLAKEGQNKVIELIMGLGKTDVIVPTTNAVIADGTRIVVNVVPKQVAPTIFKLTSTKGKKIYGQNSSGFGFSRAWLLSLNVLQAMKVMFTRTKEEKEVVNSVKEDLQALELQFFEWLFALVHPEMRTSKGSDAEILELKEILHQLRKEGKVVGDEAQDIFYLRQELNYPLGPKSTIPENYYKIMEACTKILVSDPEFAKLNELNELGKLKDEISTRLGPLIGNKMSREPLFQLFEEAQRKDFVEYVTGQSKSIPQSMKDHPRFKEINMVKGVIGVLLETAVANPAHVGYGDDGSEYAKPFDGNMSPTQNATIQDAYETMFKTFILTFQRGLTETQIRHFVTKFQKKAEELSKKHGIRVKETKPFKMFARIFPDYDLMEIFKYPKEQQNAFFKEAKRNRECIFTYLQLFVYRKISYWKLGLTSNAQNFFSMFDSGFYDTGTPYNNGTYPPLLKMLWDAGTIGEALHIMTNKCAENAVHVLENSQPTLILKEILQKHFVPGSNFSSIIDGGALFKGLDNQTVAKAMLESIQAREDLKAIVFFQKDASGKDELVYLEKGNLNVKPKPFDRCPYKPEEYLTYFDENHGFAANVPQMKNGKGFKLVGPNSRLYKEMQEWFRMRGLKYNTWVMPIKDEMVEGSPQPNTETQQIHIAMTRDMRDKISKSEIPTLKEVLTYSLRQEALEAAQDNYDSYRQKVQNVIRRSVLDKIYNCKTVAEMCALFKEFFYVFVKRIEDDPEKLYGWVKESKSTADVLAQFKKDQFEIINKSSSFSAVESRKVLDALDAIELYPMPESVTVFLNGEELNIDHLDNLGKEVTHENIQNVDLNQELDQQLDIELNQEMSSQDQKHKPAEFKEWDWSQNLDAYSTDWQHTAESKTDVGMFGRLRQRLGLDQSPTPPIFRFRDVVKQSRLPALAKIWEKIDSRLWFSNNFIPQVVRSFGETIVAFGSKEQRELFEVLVDLKERTDGTYEIISLGCLSLRDAAYWREKLYKGANPSGGQQLKRILWDPTLRTVVAGDNVDVERLKKEPELIMLESQAKFFNGDARYESCHIDALRKWFTTTGDDPFLMRNASGQIYNARGKKDYAMSELENLFEELIPST